MSVNPSDKMAAQANPGKTVFPNLARADKDEQTCKAVDLQVIGELGAAGITPEGPYEFLRRGEVPTGVVGTLCLWSFKRAWYYYVAEGPGVPADRAEQFHKEWGTQVRVNGHCGCPSPLEQHHGFAIGMYHIDTQEGLNAFAELLRSIYHGVATECNR